MQKNFVRMLQLADEVFATKEDPSQLDVNENVIQLLQQIHPASVSELANEEGPYCWILLLPTTAPLMQEFLHKKISEKELFKRTPVGAAYQCLYLCSAMLLPEFRHQGIARQAALKAIEAIRQQHQIENLFVWPFSTEGNRSARAIAAAVHLPLLTRME